MPTRYFVALDAVEGAVKPDFLHAAISRWFDDDANDHRRPVKPYTISPVTGVKAELGVEVSTLTPEAARRLEHAVASKTSVRLGTIWTRLATLDVLDELSWSELDAIDSPRWLMEFLTPTTFRTGDVTSPFPYPSSVLRAPTQAWCEFSNLPARSLPATRAKDVRITALDLRSLTTSLDGRRVIAVQGVMSFDLGDLATLVAPLLRLAAFSGVGSFRGKGYGTVDVSPG